MVAEGEGGFRLAAKAASHKTAEECARYPNFGVLGRGYNWIKKRALAETWFIGHAVGRARDHGGDNRAARYSRRENIIATAESRSSLGGIAEGKVDIRRAAVG